MGKAWAAAGAIAGRGTTAAGAVAGGGATAAGAVGEVWRDHGATIVGAFLVLPAASFVAYRWRHRRVARRVAIAEVGLVAGSLPWAVMLFTPQPAPRSVDLVPLHDLPSWVTGDLGTAAAQIIGNLLVLGALGFFLPMRFAWFAYPPRVAAVAVVVSGMVETFQWVLAIGRVSSVDDVIINTVGAVLAAVASRRWWVRRAPTQGGRVSAGDKPTAA